MKYEVTKSGNYKKQSVECLLRQLSCPTVAPEIQIRITIKYDINDDDSECNTYEHTLVRPEAQAKAIIKQFFILKKEVSKCPYHSMGDRYRAHSAYTSEWASIFGSEPGELLSLHWKYI